MPTPDEPPAPDTPEAAWKSQLDNEQSGMRIRQTPEALCAMTRSREKLNNSVLAGAVAVTVASPSLFFTTCTKLTSHGSGLGRRGHWAYSSIFSGPRSRAAAGAGARVNRALSSWKGSTRTAIEATCAFVAGSFCLSPVWWRPGGAEAHRLGQRLGASILPRSSTNSAPGLGRFSLPGRP